jgi:EAL domain-containing protein (putative c-di-GMP-specific phosphodiesterase class I)
VKAWRDAGLLVPRVAVNVSVCQFAHERFPALVEGILRQTGLEPAVLEIEITESVLMKDGDAALGMLFSLKALGVKLAIDDFGIGYSSLSYLRQFPIDRLKIDRTFICSAHADPQSLAITTAVIALAESLNLGVTAEGVETEAQLNFLKQRRCDEAQGFFLHHPLDQAETEALLRRLPGACGLRNRPPVP